MIKSINLNYFHKPIIHIFIVTIKQHLQHHEISTRCKVVILFIKPNYYLILQVSHGWHKLPTDRFDPDFIERRRIGLEVGVYMHETATLEFYVRLTYNSIAIKLDIDTRLYPSNVSPNYAYLAFYY